MTAINHQAPIERLQSAFTKAAGSTGISFDFLVKTAARESGFQSSAKAKTSSAAGMFQFIEQTWLGVVARHGARHGLANEAAAIERQPNGRYSVKPGAVRNQILGLRHDSGLSTIMAAELAVENRNVLQSRLGRAPTDTELYSAHFLGAGKAGNLLLAAKNSPDQDASKLFPKEAAANKPIFFGSDGTARSVSQVLEELGRLHQNQPGSIPDVGLEDAPKITVSGGRPVSHRIAGGLVRSSLLQLSPVMVQLLAELSAPGAAKRSDKN
ncbi:MAG: hypothetical protein COA47_03830 [Robiginitomaculum sp.]|nr:MAG: hypothetical protein COA47_03830 [Robiginitomaculum sp.]